MSIIQEFSVSAVTNRTFYIVPFIKELCNPSEQITDPDQIFSGNGIDGQFNKSVKHNIPALYSNGENRKKK
jgi:hypothetical protein